MGHPKGSRATTRRGPRPPLPRLAGPGHRAGHALVDEEYDEDEDQEVVLEQQTDLSPRLARSLAGLQLGQGQGPLEVEPLSHQGRKAATKGLGKSEVKDWGLDAEDVEVRGLVASCRGGEGGEAVAGRSPLSRHGARRSGWSWWWTDVTDAFPLLLVAAGHDAGG